MITEEDILSIDYRIRSCIIENPTFEDNEYYVKIWFKWYSRISLQIPVRVHTDGREEFSDIDKDVVIKKIKEFLNSPFNSFYII